MKKFKTFIKVIAFKVIYPAFQLLKLKSNFILFNSDNGKSFNGNPKAIYEYLSDIYKDKNVYYVVTGKFSDKLNNHVINVKYMSLKYLYYLAISKYWVISVNMYSGVHPRKKQVYLQTWHGTPLKKIGADIEDDSREKEKREWLKDANNWTYFISNGMKSNENYKTAFGIKDDQILDYGLPRNDKLGNNMSLYNSFRNSRKISNNKKVLLYAPTFRDDGSEIEFDFNRFSKILGDKYYLLVNFHRLYKHRPVRTYSNIEFNEKMSINDCMEISDALITDYSSVFFDYSILNKPMFFYPYDYDKYVNNDRGTYFDYLDIVPGSVSFDFDELCKNLEDVDQFSVDNSKFSSLFNSNYEFRNATERVVKKVFKEL